MVQEKRGKITAISDETHTAKVSTAYGNLDLNHSQFDKFEKGDEVLLVIRPETIPLSGSDGPTQQNTFNGIIESFMYAGNFVKYTIKIEDKKMIVDQYNPKDTVKFKRGDQVKITVPRSTHVLPKNTATRRP